MQKGPGRRPLPCISEGDHPDLWPAPELGAVSFWFCGWSGLRCCVGCERGGPPPHCGGVSWRHTVSTSRGLQYLQLVGSVVEAPGL